jgi:benzoyl-CoA reductase/2-hydroxyglutaryl-CoA dehydratase subunit BcrC/BadD/HgdB
MNRLETLREEFACARANCAVQVKEISEKGEEGIVGTFCQYAPMEIINAAGLHNVILCGFNHEPIALAETELPANLCPLVKSSYGHVLGKTCPFAFFSDLVVGETTCDGKKKMYEMLAELKDTHIIHLPNMPDHERGLESWVMELEHFKKVLEEKFGVAVTEENLRKSIADTNEDRRLIQQIYELGKLNPPAIKGVDMRNVMTANYFVLDKKKKKQMMRDLIDESLKAYHADRGPYPRDARPPRVMISGAGLDGVMDKTVGAIERAGGAVVCYEGCSGIVAMRRLIDEDPDKDPLLSLGEKYLDVPCAVMSPNRRRMEHLDAMLDEFAIDGVISVTLHSCNPFDIESRSIGQVCQKKEVPFMHLRTDYTPGDEGQLNTRIEAFLEMLGARGPQKEDLG